MIRGSETDVVNFLDDILIGGKNFNDRLDKLRQVLTRLEDKGITVKMHITLIKFDHHA